MSRPMRLLSDPAEDVERCPNSWQAQRNWGSTLQAEGVGSILITSVTLDWVHSHMKSTQEK